MWSKETNANEPSKRCRNPKGGVKTGAPTLLRDKSRGYLFTVWAASGIQVA
jgi:hypothetical protein